ncbi:hypothetical protein [Oceanobacillus neutriphilus]|uniref:Uncharacterized protein n=1 Tax=Oceanobacillus neutriphilus TaxID=531815 RepID=A0ABQ2NPJ6_9BACI|nr:hypothetical protein [Oceanobacillus neutriphilus]GGP07322.1 hypothetical protein GCM10011346_02850 [Oceanobacillus neutriphilus]
MNDDAIRLYKVVETADLSAEELQEILNNATDDMREMQIDHVVGTKIILGHDSLLNAKGREEARVKRAASKLSAEASMIANAIATENSLKRRGLSDV